VKAALPPVMAGSPRLWHAGARHFPRKRIERASMSVKVRAAKTFGKRVAEAVLHDRDRSPLCLPWLVGLFALATMCLLPGGRSYADDPDVPRQFNADTPGKAYTPYTVAEGYFQIESDIFHVTEQGGTQTIEFLDPVFKYGLTNTIEIAFQTNGFYNITSEQNAKASHAFGYGDVVPSFKWGFLGDDSQSFSAAFRFGIKIPTASSRIGNGAVEYYAVLPTQMTLPYGFSMQIQEEIDLLRHAADNGKYFSYSEDLSLSRNFSRVTVTGELFAQSGTDPGNQAYYTADVGLSYLATPTIAVVAGAYVGLNKVAPSIEAYTGFAFRF
jgi:hypothetical protein